MIITTTIIVVTIIKFLKITRTFLRSFSSFLFVKEESSDRKEKLYHQ